MHPPGLDPCANPHPHLEPKQVGDATLGVTIFGKTHAASSRNQPGPLFTFYDPSRGATVLDEKTPGEQPGFEGVAYGVAGKAELEGLSEAQALLVPAVQPGAIVLTGENFAPTPQLRSAPHAGPCPCPCRSP